jgi:hypothetical protein
VAGLGHTLLVSECDGHPYRVVYMICLRLRWVGWQADPPASLIGSFQATTQELNPRGSQVNPSLIIRVGYLTKADRRSNPDSEMLLSRL